jgi:thiol-disulfide isomerase/thioredoxin
MKIFIFFIISLISIQSFADEVHNVSFDGEKASFTEYSGEFDTVFNLDDSQNIEILYFFNYNCPSCFKMYPYINFWERIVKTDNIRLERIPVSLTDDWKYSSKLYFLRNIMGFNLKFDNELYKLINYKTININSDKDIIDFFVKYNFATEDVITDNLDSNKLKYSMVRSNQIIKSLKITGTPRIIVTKNKKRYEINLNDNNKPISVIIALNEIIKSEKKN